MNRVATAAQAQQLRNKVDQAWTHRWTSQIESAIRVFPELRSELGLSLYGATSSDIEASWKTHTRTATEALLASDAVLLSASVLRVKGHLEQAAAALADAQSVLAAAGLSGSFRFHFERALMAFMQGNYLPAIEDFFAASRYTEHALYKLIALTNAMLCLENFGIEHDRVLEEVEELRRKLARSTDPVFRANESQLRAFRMRIAFRRGEVSGCLAEIPVRAGAKVLDQPSSYARWIRLLPYVAARKPIGRAESAELLAGDQSFFQKGYSVRTLLGHTHADDSSFIKTSDRIDRLYLWTWLWLESPETFGADRLMTAVNEVVTRIELSRLTLEDQFLLRNSLGWLSLADDSFRNKVRPVLKRLEAVAGHGFGLFEMEWAIIRLFQSKIDRQKVVYQDTLKYLQAHPLWRSKDVQLSELVLQMGEHPIAKRILARTMRTAASTAKRLRIDLNTYVIEDLEFGRKVVSQPMATAFNLIRSRDDLTCEELAREAFGIRVYDSFIHSPKVSNLLARMRVLTEGQIGIRVRSGMLLIEGSWDRIEFVEPFRLSSLLRGDSPSLHLAPIRIEDARDRKSLTLARFYKQYADAESFSREEVQNAFGLSKSTVTRLIEKLLTEGKIERDGSGRATSYRFRRPDAQAVLE